MDPQEYNRSIRFKPGSLIGLKDHVSKNGKKMNWKMNWVAYPLHNAFEKADRSVLLALGLYKKIMPGEYCLVLGHIDNREELWPKVLFGEEIYVLETRWPWFDQPTLWINEVFEEIYRR